MNIRVVCCGVLAFLAASSHAALVTYNFTGTGLNNAVATGFFTVDTAAMPDSDRPDISSAFWIGTGDTPVVDFELGVTDDFQNINFSAFSPIDNSNPSISVTAGVSDNRVTQNNPLLEDAFNFTMASPSLPDENLFTTESGGVFTTLLQAILTINGDVNVLDGRSLPSDMDLSAATTATLVISTPTFVLNPNTGEYIAIGGNSSRYDLTSLEVQAVPLPAAVWFFGSGLLGMAGFRKLKR